MLLSTHGLQIPEECITQIADLLRAYQMRLMLLPKEPYTHALTDLYHGTVVVVLPYPVHISPVVYAVYKKLQCSGTDGTLALHGSSATVGAHNNLRIPRSCGKNPKKFCVAFEYEGAMCHLDADFTVGSIRVRPKGCCDPDVIIPINRSLPEEYMLRHIIEYTAPPGTEECLEYALD